MTAAKAGVPGRAANSAGEYSAIGSRIEICKVVIVGISYTVAHIRGAYPWRISERGVLTLMCQLEARAPLIARA